MEETLIEAFFEKGGCIDNMGRKGRKRRSFSRILCYAFLTWSLTATGGGDLVCKNKRREKGRDKIFSFERRLRCPRKLNLENLSNTK